MAAELFDGEPFTRAMAAAAGLPERWVRNNLTAGRLRRVLHGVFIDSDTSMTPVLRARAVGCALPPDVLACRTTAAWIWGIPPLRVNEHLVTPALEVVRPAGKAAVRRPGTSGRTAIFHEEDVCMLHDVRLTSPARTAVDCARWLERKDGLAYVDAFLARRLVDGDELQLALLRQAGRPWIEQARELVSYADGRAGSPGESWMRLRWLDAGFPRPELQIPLTDKDGRVRVYLDAGLPARKFAVEYDGLEFHGPDRADHDATRRTWIAREHGWDVVVVGKGDVLGRSQAFEATLAERLGQAPILLPEQLRRRTRRATRRRLPSAGCA